LKTALNVKGGGRPSLHPLKDFLKLLLGIVYAYFICIWDTITYTIYAI
jgi:hypothetical protein